MLKCIMANKVSQDFSECLSGLEAVKPSVPSSLVSVRLVRVSAAAVVVNPGWFEGRSASQGMGTGAGEAQLAVLQWYFEPTTICAHSLSRLPTVWSHQYMCSACPGLQVLQKNRRKRREKRKNIHTERVKSNPWHFAAKHHSDSQPLCPSLFPKSSPTELTSNHLWESYSFKDTVVFFWSPTRQSLPGHFSLFGVIICQPHR